MANTVAENVRPSAPRSCCIPRGEDVQRLPGNAKALEAAGAFAILIEMVPSDVGRAITEAIANPTVRNGVGNQIRKFKEPIAHGFLTASFVTEIGGEIDWLAMGMSFAFIRPVYAGEQITCHWLIADIDERGHAKAEVRILNAEGITALEATTTGVLPRTEERECLKQMIAGGDPANGAAGSPS